MARAIREGYLTPADELRERLAEGEKLVSSVRGKGAALQDLLYDMDRVNTLWPQLTGAGLDLRPEQGRWDTLQAVVRRQAGPIAAELASTPRPADASDAWWWCLDQIDRRRRQAAALKVGGIAALAVVAVVAAWFLFKTLFPVDPKVQAAASALLSGQTQVDNGNYVAALASFQSAAAETPGDPNAWLWVGGTQEKLGNAAAAQDAYTRARALDKGDELAFLLGRAPIYTGLGMMDQARADLDAALKLDPKSAPAYYYLSTIQEAQGQYSQAIDSLDKASSLADGEGQAELVAMSRFRMGLLMQRMQAQSLGSTGTVTPTP